MASLTALTTFAVAQPLLDLVGRNGAFLVAHRIGGIDVAVLALTIVLGVPLLLGALVLLVRRASGTAAAVVLAILVGLLLTLGILVVLRVGGIASQVHGTVHLAVAGAIGAAGAAVYLRSPTLRRMLSVAAIAAPVVLVLFLVASPARALLAPRSQDADAVTIPEPAPPIVLVIFDELPLSSLLAPDLSIDRQTYPAFAELADDAVFFSDVTASHSETFQAIPAVLTGRYTKSDALPTAASHPTNIFSLLEDQYQVRALEPLTDLCDSCGVVAAAEPSKNWLELARDLVVLQLHLSIPADLAGRLPSLDVGWRGFGDPEPQVLDRGRFREKAAAALMDDTGARFTEFTTGITASSRPTLNVVHTLLPHRPWRYLPDGREHLGMNDVIVGDQWPTIEWAAAHGLQLHYAQTQYADELLGQLLRHLKETGVYDKALVVVAADHGMSLIPGTPTRRVVEETLDDIAAVPLFVKVPGQKGGAVSDRPLETVDILPTILDVLGAEPPPSLDGTSAFDTGPMRTERRLFDEAGTRWQIAAPQARVDEAVRQKFELFGHDDEFDLYRLSPPGYEDLYGKRVPAQLPEAETLTLLLAREDAYADVDRSSRVVPAAVAGRIEGLTAGSQPLPLAIAVNGVIRAVTLADVETATPGTFRAMVPPSALRDGNNDIAVYTVDAHRQLTRIPPPLR